MQTCKGENDVLVGRPIDLAAIREKGGVLTRITATEDIYIDNPDAPWPSARVLLYRKGDYVREDDAVFLGLVDRPVVPPADKAKRGPREVPAGRASRDRALNVKED